MQNNPPKHLFRSFFMGGFECSSHRRADGRRLDMIDATEHDRFAVKDYERLSEIGIFTARDGLRWHLIESEPGRYDFASIEKQLEAAAECGIQVIWDLFHYGYPNHIEIFEENFPERLADLGAAFAQYHLHITGYAPLVVPVNEISFFSWMAGDVGQFFPYGIGRADEVKRQSVLAFIAASRAVKDVAPKGRILASEPIVYVTHRSHEPEIAAEAEDYRLAQYEALDMLTGRGFAELGGSHDVVDMIGLNFYPHNQWFYPDREMIPIDSHLYRPFKQLLSETASRYQLPIFISETGTEDDARAAWFRYVLEECEAALNDGIDLQGICLYPVVNHPGWDDERHCHNGLWDYCDNEGNRPIYQPLADELRRAIERLAHSQSSS